MVITRSKKECPATTNQDSGITTEPAVSTQQAPQSDVIAARSHDESMHTIVDAAVQRTDTRSKRTINSSTSTVARRKREAELAAAEKCAEIERDRLTKLAELEKEMVQKRLQAELDNIEEDNDDSDPDDDHSALRDVTVERTQNWVRDRVRASRPLITGLPTAPAAPTGLPHDTGERAADDVHHQDSEITQLARAINKLAMRSDRHAAKLPDYTGVVGEWLSFKAAYDENKHNFNNSENLARLRRSLHGEAKAAVSNQLIGKGDPNEVMDTLNKRFGRAEYIVDDELQSLRDLPKLIDVPRQINVYACKVQNTVAALRALGEDDHLRSTDVARAVKAKLAPLMQEWISYAFLRQNDKSPELVKISEFLTEQADKYSLAWRVERVTTTPPAARPTTLLRQQRPPPTRGATATARSPHLIHSAAMTSDPLSPTCPQCNVSDHDLPRCANFKRMNNDEKWNFVRATLLCFRCLKKGHRSSVCRSQKGCAVHGCGRRHHTLLHDQAAPQTVALSEHTDSSSQSEVVASASAPRGRALLKILPVTVHGPRGSVRTHALLDDGSTITLVKSELADQIGARGPRERLSIAGITTPCVLDDSRRVSLEISGATDERHTLHNAHTMRELRLTTQTVDEVSRLEYLRDLPIDSYKDATPEILIGQDNWHLLLADEVRCRRRDEPAASHTPLGWVLHGGTGGRGRTAYCIQNFVGHASADRALDEIVKQHYKLEALGVSTTERRRPDHERALHILKTTCQRVDDDERWQAGLLWKTDETTMPPSYNSALRRLRTLEKKMDSDRVFGEAYVAQMQHLIDAGYASIALPTDSKKEWHLPHFAVVNPHKPGKVRIVFDAAARVDGRSLNDVLATGPDLLQSLLGVLFRFREGKVAVAADIREMFLRIKIAPNDRPAQRFLWRGWDRKSKPTTYEMTSLIFGAASSPTTAIYIKNKNAKEFSQQHSEAAHAIERHFYMDDYLQSFNDPADATRIALEVAKVNRKGGFHLTSWASNHPITLYNLNPDRLNEPRDLNLQTPEEKTLGLRWDPTSDTLGFNISMARVPKDIAAGTRCPTKRQMLSVVMSVFDPLGLLTPIIIQAKTLLQKVWRSGIGWDDNLNDQEAGQWFDWLRRLQASWTCRVPRCYQQRTEQTTVELHTFCDASEDAYAAASYFRFLSSEGHCETVLVSSKSRVTPLKPVSMPRLELQAALLGSRLAASILEEHTLQPTRCVFWTDSRTVLAWIQGDPRNYKAFVSHRLGEIDELTNVDQWRWVPTLENVADDATRSLPFLTAEHRWFRGPEFLARPEHEWPTQPTLSTPTTDDDELRRKESILETTAAICTPDTSTTALPDASRFSSWSRLVRTTAQVFIFVEKCRQQHQGGMRRRHLDRAEQSWMRKIQSDAFSPELQCLRARRPLPKASRLQHLSPYIDADGVLRLGGRASAAPGIDRRTTEPVILCGQHPVTRLLVYHHHQLAHHANPETVVNRLRESYWIVHLRPTVRAVARACQFCRVRAATAQSPSMGDLPEVRLGHHHRAFTYCAVDYFGPLAVAVGRRREKRYGALFTCLVTRAVHLEVAASLTTDSAIAALRRLIARRGPPSVIYSDNGTNFHGANNELRRAWVEVDQEAVRTFALTKGADWHFIPPAAPFMGGAWERLVGSVRRALEVTLQERAPTDEVLTTLLAEAEYTINSRPLTHVSVDPADPEALTPNHFLLGSATAAPTPGVFHDSDLVRRQQWRATQRLADMFWQRWIREYLPTLLPRRQRGDDRPELSVGDLVIIADADLPRNVWPRGIIERVLPGKDGHVRVADVRTCGGVLRRPARKIVRLPVERVVEGHSTTGGSMSTTADSPDN